MLMSFMLRKEESGYHLFVTLKHVKLVTSIENKSRGIMFK